MGGAGLTGRFWDGVGFGKLLDYPENPNSYYLSEMPKPSEHTGLPPWFPDLDECRRCTIGAMWGQWFGSVELVCGNRDHFLEKLARGVDDYRERLQEARERHDTELAHRYEGLVEELGSMSPELPRLVLSAMTARDVRLIWRHPLGVYHADWSDEGPITARVRMLLGQPAKPFTGYQTFGTYETIPQQLAALSQDGAEELLALLVVMRDMAGWSATPEELAKVPQGTFRQLSAELSAFLHDPDLPDLDVEAVPEGLAIADLYVCWDCKNHHIPVEPDEDPPAFHVDCGGALEWSGRLMSYDPETGIFGRTWDEKPRMPQVAGREEALAAAAT